MKSMIAAVFFENKPAFLDFARKLTKGFHIFYKTPLLIRLPLSLTSTK